MNIVEPMIAEDDLEVEIAALERRLGQLDQERETVIAALEQLRMRHGAGLQPNLAPPMVVRATPSGALSGADKIALFRSLFRGRNDVFPRRWENLKTGKAGYSPACRNEWIRGICQKPKIKCSDCPNQAFVPVSDEVIRSHLQGQNLANPVRAEGFIAGVYPLMPDESCWFLAADFDKQSWQRDALAFLTTCRDKGVPAALERSRSGNGGHVWIFFSESVPASDARKLGAHLITETMERCPDIGFESYDRFFPSQDTMPAGGFGNLIAMPLQSDPRQNGNSVFVDDALQPFEDQWAFTACVGVMFQQSHQGRTLHCPAADAAIIIALLQDLPSQPRLRGDECLAGFSLGIEGVEVLLQSLFRGLAGVDGAAQDGHVPKNLGPDQRAPVISRAMAERER